MKKGSFCWKCHCKMADWWLEIINDCTYKIDICQNCLLKRWGNLYTNDCIYFLKKAVVNIRTNTCQNCLLKTWGDDNE